MNHFIVYFELLIEEKKAIDMSNEKNKKRKENQGKVA